MGRWGGGERGKNECLNKIKKEKVISKILKKNKYGIKLKATVMT